VVKNVTISDLYVHAQGRLKARVGSQRVDVQPALWGGRVRAPLAAKVQQHAGQHHRHNPVPFRQRKQDSYNCQK